jgi:hypothetical protein
MGQIITTIYRTAYPSTVEHSNLHERLYYFSCADVRENAPHVCRRIDAEASSLTNMPCSCCASFTLGNWWKILHVTEIVRTFSAKYYPKFLDNTLIKLRFTSATNVRTASFWVITQRVVVISYHYSLLNNPEKNCSQILRGGSVKSRT